MAVDPRQELEDLRRIDELERKAGGGKAAPKTAPPKEEPESPTSFKNLVGAGIEPLITMGTGAVAAPVSGLAGILGTLLPGPQGQGAKWTEGVGRALTHEPRTEGGKTAMGAISYPFQKIREGAEWAGGKTTDITGSPLLGTGVSTTLQGLPQVFGAKGAAGAAERVPSVIPKIPVGAGMKAESRRLMQSALKPTQEAQRTGKADKAIDTLLEMGINVTPGGVGKMQNRIAVLNDKIKDIVDSSTATVDKKAVVSELQGELDKAMKQVTPQTDMASIQKVWKNFLNHPLLKEIPVKRAAEERPGVESTLRKAASEQPGPPLSRTLEQVAGEQPGRPTAPPNMPIPQGPPKPIPVKTAQELKQGTYRALGDKSYGELKGAEIEAQKALARGLKEEIAKAVPEVRPLNAEESKLLNALSVSERRVMMEANKNPLGLGVLAMHPTALLAWLADRSGMFKSIAARMLNKASNLPTSPQMVAPGIPIGAAQSAAMAPPPPQ